MAFYIKGGFTTLSASGSGSIRLRIGVDGEITQFLVNSTGRVQITNIEVSGEKDFFDGTMEIEQFKEYGNVYHIPEPIPIKKGDDIVFSLTDISGASNDVYIGVEIRKAE